MNKPIILLNGPSSSGKSTLAKALQVTIQETRGLHFTIISIDDFLPMSPDEPIFEDDVYAISATLCKKVSETLQTTPGVIIDHVITSRRIFEQLTDALSLHRLRLVRVTCPSEILCAREAARKNRCLGSAEASERWLFPREGYDITVDTHELTAEECAAVICNSLF